MSHYVIQNGWLLSNFDNLGFVAWTRDPAAALQFSPSEAWAIACILNAHRYPERMVRVATLFPSN